MRRYIQPTLWLITVVVCLVCTYRLDDHACAFGAAVGACLGTTNFVLSLMLALFERDKDAQDA